MQGATTDAAEQARTVANGIAAVIDGRMESFSLDHPCHTVHGERWFRVHVAALGDGLQGAVVWRFDISARKQAEDRARRVRAYAVQAAWVSAVGVLSASLIHALSRPLSAASLYSGTALALLSRAGMDCDRLQTTLEGIELQIGRATEILPRPRGFLRQCETRLEPVAIEEVIAGAMGLVEWFAADCQVRFRFMRAEPRPVVLVDLIQLEQVRVDLVCNGIQAINAAATPSAGGRHRSRGAPG